MTFAHQRLLAHALLALAFILIALNLYALVVDSAPTWMSGWAVPGAIFALVASRLYRRSRA